MFSNIGEQNHAKIRAALKTKTIGEDFGSGYIISATTFDAHHRAVATSLPKEVSSLGYSYNKQGFVTQLTDNSNTAGNWSSSTETYHYNDKAHRQLTSVDQTVAGISQVNAYVYRYDALGNIRRLTSIDLNNGGRRIQKSFDYGSSSTPHRITSINAQASLSSASRYTFKYDEEGSVTFDGR